jgi:hypothetical protein
MKTLALLLLLLAVPLAAVAASVPAGAPPVPRFDASPLYYGGTVNKVAVDTVILMGPRGLYPYRGDFETALPRPLSPGTLPDGWVSRDFTVPHNGRWQLSTYNNPGTGYGAWCGTMDLDSCGPGDPAGGYGNNWHAILELRKPVSGAATVRVQARLRYDNEPGYDYLFLQRRTAVAPDLEPVSGGQGLVWNGQGTVDVDYVFTYSSAELVGGTEVAVAFVFDSDGAWSDEDCLWPTAGASTIDDITVTIDDGTVTVYHEDFEDQQLGPDWMPGPDPVGVGDFARVWSRLGDRDRCHGNLTNQVAFLDDGLVVPGTGGTVGLPDSYDYGTPEGWVVNGTMGLLGPWHDLDSHALSPVMSLPGNGIDGVSVSFDTYVHHLSSGLSAGTYGSWAIRSTAGGSIESAPWVSRDYGSIASSALGYRRLGFPVGDLLVPGATHLQVRLGVRQLCAFWWCEGTVTTPAPYFDNVRAAVYPSAGPRIVASERHLANDGFPAGGVLDLADPARNSLRFDMASPGWSTGGYVATVPGDSITIDVTPRSGATLDTPVLHWTLARRNPVFDPYRTLPPGPVTGRVTRYPGGGVVENRWNFDLPDTGFLFPGDVLHYYFAATDHAGGDTRITTLPADLSGFGNDDPLAYPGYCTVRCLPTVADLQGAQPRVLFWNDQGFGDGEDEWHGALRRLGFREGVDYDVYTTHAPASGLGNGLGGRASVAQIAGYTDLLYSSGELGAPTISTGDNPYGDRGDDLGLLEAWLVLGGRDLFLSGDDLAYDLYTRGTRSRTFVTSRMGVICHDTEVNIDIDDQDGPLVAVTAGNPVFQPTSAWVVHGACPRRGDFDAVTVTGGGVRLAQFTAPDGVSTPYPYAAAVLNAVGDTRVVSLCYDLLRVTGGAKSPAPPGARDQALGDVLAYFGATGTSAPAATMPPSAAATLTVFPNPFNPSVKLRWELLQPTPLTLKIFDVRGALVRTLADRLPAEAVGELTWNGDDDGGGEVASGVYFVEARASGQVRVEKITLVR